MGNSCRQVFIRFGSLILNINTNWRSVNSQKLNMTFLSFIWNENRLFLLRKGFLSFFHYYILLLVDEPLRDLRFSRIVRKLQCNISLQFSNKWHMHKLNWMKKKSDKNVLARAKNKLPSPFNICIRKDICQKKRNKLQSTCVYRIPCTMYLCITNTSGLYHSMHCMR